MAAERLGVMFQQGEKLEGREELVDDGVKCGGMEGVGGVEGIEPEFMSISADTKEHRKAYFSFSVHSLSFVLHISSFILNPSFTTPCTIRHSSFIHHLPTIPSPATIHPSPFTIHLPLHHSHYSPPPHHA